MICFDNPWQRILLDLDLKVRRGEGERPPGLSRCFISVHSLIYSAYVLDYAYTDNAYALNLPE